MDKKLAKLYELAFNNLEITKQSLKEINLDRKEIKLLIKNGVLEKIKAKSIKEWFKGPKYLFVNIDSLISYAKFLQEEGNLNTTYYEKILTITSNKNVSLNLLLLYIKNKNYDKAFNLFLKIYQDGYDYNFYLYLFSMLMDLDEEYVLKVKKIHYKDMVSHDNLDDYNLDILNNARLHANWHKFVACRSLIEKLDENDVTNQITLALLDQIIEQEDIRRENDLSLAKNKQYNELITILEEREKVRNLNKISKYILILSRVYINIEESLIEKKEEIPVTNLFETIDNKDYKLALTLEENYCRERGYLRSENILFIVLKDIVSKLETIEKKVAATSPQEEKELPPSDITINKDISKIETIEKEEVEVISSQEEELPITIKFNKIIELLQENKLNESIDIIKEWLNLINKSEYEFLILDLLEIVKLESYNSLSNVIDMLTQIKEDRYNYRLGEYIVKFYKELTNNKLDKARIYLDIIKNSGKLGQECSLSCSFENIIENEKYGHKYKTIRKDF